jgi:hypothetical protein
MKISILILILTQMFLPLASFAMQRDSASDIHIDFVSDDGRVYSVHEIERKGSSRRAWLEAVNGENYSVRVFNNSNQRVALLIAIDGRNIISGRKSNLSHTERMYVLNSGQSARYDGWRTSNRKVNQFFFTTIDNSYAEAWQDRSAMGVIAVAVFKEFQTYKPLAQIAEPEFYERSDSTRESEMVSGKAESSRVFKKQKQQAGTGFGQERVSHAELVKFEPLKTATSKSFFKYEWRDSLCQKRVIDCSVKNTNRFWPEEDSFRYAPYPPR